MSPTQNTIMKEFSFQAVKLIKNADAIAVFAGAGMGVDSGLEQYRGKGGLWTKSIVVNNEKVNYQDLLTHDAFDKTPEQSWAFVASLIEKYTRTIPHKGYTQLLDILKEKEYFIVTSNCDEHFQKAGFDELRHWECHGSIFNMQCMDILERDIYKTPLLSIDPITQTLIGGVPKCPKCGLNCRPNMYLFYDWFWVSNNSVAQQIRYNSWQKEIKEKKNKIVAIEIGAGKTIDTIRKTARRFTNDTIPLIRINPYDFEIENPNEISVGNGAKEFFERLEVSNVIKVP